MDGEARAARELRKARKDEMSDRGFPMGYTNQGGESLEVTGDDDAPHIKEPPFETNVQRYFRTDDDIELTDEFRDLPSISTAGRRLIQLYADYTPSDDAVDAVLVLRYQGEREEGVFRTLAVVDAMLVVTPSSNVAHRLVFASELRFPTLQGGDESAGIILPFDVTGFVRVRFQVREELEDGESGALDLRYRQSL
jgi:hypothetical protein